MCSIIVTLHGGVWVDLRHTHDGRVVDQLLIGVHRIKAWRLDLSVFFNNGSLFSRGFIANMWWLFDNWVPYVVGCLYFFVLCFSGIHSFKSLNRVKIVDILGLLEKRFSELWTYRITFMRAYIRFFFIDRHSWTMRLSQLLGWHIGRLLMESFFYRSTVWRINGLYIRVHFFLIFEEITQVVIFLVLCKIPNSCNCKAKKDQRSGDSY